MRIRLSQLRRIIKEEIERLSLDEGDGDTIKHGEMTVEDILAYLTKKEGGRTIKPGELKVNDILAAAAEIDAQEKSK